VAGGYSAQAAVEVSHYHHALLLSSGECHPPSSPQVSCLALSRWSPSRMSQTQRSSLFVSKLGLCRVVLDFLDPNKNSVEKDVKRQALLDLIVEYVESTNSRFSKVVVAACARMCAINLFRVLPPKCRSGSSGGGEGDEDEPMFDPTWWHLQLVYELLLKFIGSSSLDAKVGKKHFDHSFILKLLNLFESKDPRERDC
jgi:serine/threonine-protein phosphatase 2A regulatory subunit B'